MSVTHHSSLLLSDADGSSDDCNYNSHIAHEPHPLKKRLHDSLREVKELQNAVAEYQVSEQNMNYNQIDNNN